MFHELFSSKMFVEEGKLKTFNFYCGYQMLQVDILHQKWFNRSVIPKEKRLP